MLRHGASAGSGPTVVVPPPTPEPQPVPPGRQQIYQPPPGPTPPCPMPPPPCPRSAIQRLAASISPLVLIALATLLVWTGQHITSAGNIAVTDIGTTATYAQFYQQPAHTGGTIVVAEAETPDSVNPLFAIGNPTDFVIIDAIWGNPVASGADLRWYTDELTEAPTPQNGDVSQNGLTITLHLRHDLRWSDGQPLTSADYKYG
jgi:ABC-type transport system substrate-binding protein